MTCGKSHHRREDLDLIYWATSLVPQCSTFSWLSPSISSQTIWHHLFSTGSFSVVMPTRIFAFYVNKRILFCNISHCISSLPHVAINHLANFFKYWSLHHHPCVLDSVPITLLNSFCVDGILQIQESPQNLFPTLILNSTGH